MLTYVCVAPGAHAVFEIVGLATFSVVDETVVLFVIDKVELLTQQLA